MWNVCSISESMHKENVRILIWKLSREKETQGRKLNSTNLTLRKFAKNFQIGLHSLSECKKYGRTLRPKKMWVYLGRLPQ